MQKCVSNKRTFWEFFSPLRIFDRLVELSKIGQSKLSPGHSKIQSKIPKIKSYFWTLRLFGLAQCKVVLVLCKVAWAGPWVVKVTTRGSAHKTFHFNFDPKKVNFWPKVCIFLTFVLKIFLVQTIQCKKKKKCLFVNEIMKKKILNGHKM